MFVEYITDVDNNCLAIKGAEFIKAEKSRSDFGSLQMAVDAFASLYGWKLILSWKEFNAIKSWLKKEGIIIIRYRNSIKVNKSWIEIVVQNGAHTYNAVISYDSSGENIEAYINPEKKPTKKDQN